MHRWLYLVVLLIVSPAAAETLGVWTFTSPDGYTVADTSDGRPRASSALRSRCNEAGSSVIIA